MIKERSSWTVVFSRVVFLLICLVSCGCQGLSSIQPGVYLSRGMPSDNLIVSGNRWELGREGETAFYAVFCDIPERFIRGAEYLVYDKDDVFHRRAYCVKYVRPGVIAIHRKSVPPFPEKPVKLLYLQSL